MTPRFNTFVLAGLASLALGSAAAAADSTVLHNPGSLLIFPYFDNDRAFRTFITVVNTSPDTSVRIEYVYIRHEEQIFWNGDNNPLFPLDCTEFNRTRTLTANDTLTVDTKSDNPNQHHKGYVYVFAKSAVGNDAISWNHLIGEQRVVGAAETDSDNEMQPFTYKGIGADGTVLATAPVTASHLLLNDVKYQATSDLLLFPRFTGDDDDSGLDQFESEHQLIFIALSGGSQFTTLIDLLVYNDNEDVFSAQVSVRCWNRIDLQYLDVFSDSFLKGTNTNTENMNGNETGWFTAHGLIASSSSNTITGPAILGVLLESLEDDTGSTTYQESTGAIIPYGTGNNTKGVLLSHALDGA